MVRVIGALCIYNEADTIQRALDSCVRLGIVDIHVQDGPWEGTGYTSPTSTDGTVDVIKEWAKSKPCKVHVMARTEPFRTEGDKRNFQLDAIQEMARRNNEQEYVVFVIDGDEEVRFPNGLEKFNLGKALDSVDTATRESQKKYQLGMVKCFAYNSDRALWSPRLIPSGKGIHYHTEVNMRIHDDNCDLICSYDPEDQQIGSYTKKTIRPEYIDEFFIVNHWNSKERLLDDARMEAKDRYYTQQRERKANLRENHCQRVKAVAL